MHQSNAKLSIFNLAFAALLAALVVVLQIWGGIPLGPFNITLTLVPIVIGAILLGWECGLALGVVFGLIVSILSVTGRDVGGSMVFQANFIIGWIMCILKGAAAGVVPALLYRAFTRFKYAPHIFCALSGAFLFLGGFAVAKLVHLEKTWQMTSLVIFLLLVAALYMVLAHWALKSDNTAIFLAAMSAPICNTGIFILGMSVFYPALLQTWAGGTHVAMYIIVGLVGVNFLIEFSLSVLLAPAIATIVKAAKKTR